jgi:hypothetical protein
MDRISGADKPLPSLLGRFNSSCVKPARVLFGRDVQPAVARSTGSEFASSYGCVVKLPAGAPVL